MSPIDRFFINLIKSHSIDFILENLGVLREYIKALREANPDLIDAIYLSETHRFLMSKDYEYFIFALSEYCLDCLDHGEITFHEDNFQEAVSLNKDIIRDYGVALESIRQDIRQNVRGVWHGLE